MHRKGIGAVRWQSEIITITEELSLWDSDVLRMHSLSALLNSVFFYNGLNFVLRCGEEHRQLKISQLLFADDVVHPSNPRTTTSCVKYVEHESKNCPGGRHQLNLENKGVVQYAQAQVGERCHVYLLKLYLSKLPKCAVEQDAFYWNPRKEIPPDNEPCYTRNVVGHNVLDKMLKNMFIESGLNAEHKSNHSLRATANITINRLYAIDAIMRHAHINFKTR